MSKPEAPPIWKKFLRGGVYLFLLILLLGSATMAGWIVRSETVRGVLSGMMGEAPHKVFGAEKLTLLVLGCDQDLSPGGKVVRAKAARSDMMLLVNMDFPNQRISALSIPRDIRLRTTDYGVRIPEGDYLKLNGFHAHGGPTVTQKVVEQLLKIKVDRTVVVDFVAFQQLIDQLGGIDIYVEKSMKYDDNAGGLHIDLKKGRQKLTGYQAMGYVRFRKATGESDFTRQQRQKEVLFAVKDQVISRPTVIPDVADKAVEILGRSLTGRELGSVIWFSSKVNSSKVKMGSIPVNEIKRRRIYYQDIRPRETQKILREFGFIGESSTEGSKVTS